MEVYEHPHLPGHVVLHATACPEMFRMLTEVAGVRDAVRHDPSLGGFVMTLDLYQRLRHGLQTAGSLRDLVGLCPPNTVAVPPVVAPAPPAPPRRSVHTQTTEAGGRSRGPGRMPVVATKTVEVQTVEPCPPSSPAATRPEPIPTPTPPLPVATARQLRLLLESSAPSCHPEAPPLPPSPTGDGAEEHEADGGASPPSVAGASQQDMRPPGPRSVLEKRPWTTMSPLDSAAGVRRGLCPSDAQSGYSNFWEIQRGRFLNDGLGLSDAGTLLPD